MYMYKSNQLSHWTQPTLYENGAIAKAMTESKPKTTTIPLILSDPPEAHFDGFYIILNVQGV